MGYYSTVGIKCQGEAFKEFAAVICEYDFTPDEIRKYDNGEYSMSWDSIKWYPSSPGVQAIESVMEDLDEYDDENDGYGYAFCRLGEEMDDNECRDNYHYIELDVVRTIEFGYGGHIVDSTDDSIRCIAGNRSQDDSLNIILDDTIDFTPN